MATMRFTSLAFRLVLQLLLVLLVPANVSAQEAAATDFANPVELGLEGEALNLRRRLQVSNCGAGGSSPCSTTTTTTTSTISTSSSSTTTTSTTTSTTTVTITTTTKTSTTETTTTTTSSTTTRTTSTTSAIPAGTRYSVDLEGFYIMLLDDPAGFVGNSEAEAALKPAIATLASIASSKVSVSLSLWSRRLLVDGEEEEGLRGRRLVDGNVRLDYRLSLSELDGPEAQTHAQEIWNAMFQTSTADLTSDFQFMVDGKVTTGSYDLSVTLASAPARYFIQGTTTITTTTTTTAKSKDASQAGDEAAEEAHKSFKKGIIVALAVAIGCCCLAMCAKFALGIHFSSNSEAVVHPEPPEADQIIASAPVEIHVLDISDTTDPTSTLNPKLRALANDDFNFNFDVRHVDQQTPPRAPP